MAAPYGDTMPVILRPLTSADAAELARLHVAVWRATYRGLMSDDALATLDPDRFEQGWRKTFATPMPPTVIGAFDEASSALVGWICVGAARDADAPAEVELWVLNLDPAWHGAGVARDLMARGLGDRPAYLWVVEGNDRAIAFYRKHGFELDGEARLEDEGNRDLRMVRTAVGG